MLVVVMFEYARRGENLTPSQQVNEIFGPFNTEEEADKWTERARDLIAGRHWLITELSDLTVLNKLDPKIN